LRSERWPAEEAAKKTQTVRSFTRRRLVRQPFPEDIERERVVIAGLPLYHLMEAHVLAAERLHGDDTTVPILAKGKTVTGHIWAYVRDDRPFCGPAPPAAVY